MNAGFRYGIIGGVIIAVLYLLTSIFVPYVNVWDVFGSLRWYPADIFIQFIELALCYFLARAAAEAHHEDNLRRNVDPHTMGVQAAGMGAAMVTCILGWVFYIGRWIYWDLQGSIIVMEPLSFGCLLVITFLIAVALGSLGGNSVYRKYQDDNNI